MKKSIQNSLLLEKVASIIVVIFYYSMSLCEQKECLHDQEKQTRQGNAFLVASIFTFHEFLY